MKTLADLKRALSVGSKWQGFHHFQNRDLGVREVSKVQSKAVAFATPGGDSWLEFPKASQVKFDADGNGFTLVNDQGQAVLSYKQVDKS